MTTHQDSASLSPSTVVLPLHSDIWTRTLKWCPSDRQKQQFQMLYQRICDANRSVNLTRITEAEEFWEKHLWDSLSGVQSFLVDPSSTLEQKPDISEETADKPIETGEGDDQCETTGEAQQDRPSDSTQLKFYRVLDIGSGAGFPGLPIAIAFPQWSVTLLDSTRKKMAFAQSILPDLELDNVRTLVDRAETLGRDPQHRHRYNLVTIRAVATASACAEYALPFLKIDGRAILYRGRWAEFELVELKQALKKLGGAVDQIHSLSTPLSGGDRHCIVIRKTTKTPKAYPRAVGIPAKIPLT